MPLSWSSMEKTLLFCAGLMAACHFGSTGPLSAQEMTLKRAVPGEEAFACPPLGPATQPGDEELSEAGRLGSDADQALILGDLERARDLLARATQLDPTSSELAYRHARILEDLGARAEAIEQFCRVVGLGSGGGGTEDAQTRLQAILDREKTLIPDEAKESFLAGLSAADAGRMEAALRSFSTAWERAPDWADAVYNLGIIRARMGQVEAAIGDLQRYLTLRPGTDDALFVSQRIGQLRSLANLPTPSAALTLGLLFPGAGQFYSGRAWGGLTVLTLAAGAVAAGFLIEEVTVNCVGSVGSGGTCPPDRIIGEETDTPYLVYGLAAAGTAALIGAVESYFKARGRRTREIGVLVAMDVGRARLTAPALSAHGPRLHLNLVRVTF